MPRASAVTWRSADCAVDLTEALIRARTIEQTNEPALISGQAGKAQHINKETYLFLLSVCSPGKSYIDFFCELHVMKLVSYSELTKKDLQE